MTDEAASGYTLEEMLQAARAQGYSPTARLFKDWVVLGLLDQATRRGRGNRRGVERLWSENQRQLWLLLLSKRPQVKQIATLCNIPVAIWLWWGEDYVPQKQAERALSTWAFSREHVPWRRARWTAEQLVGQIAHPDASSADRERLLEAVAKVAYGGPFQPQQILDLFRRVFDPNGSGRSIGPAWMRFDGEGYVLITEVRLNAIAALREGTFTSEDFEWARREYCATRSRYSDLAPSLASDPEASVLFLKQSSGGVFLPPTFEEIANQACIDLLTVLGFRLRSLQAAGSNPPEEAKDST